MSTPQISISDPQKQRISPEPLQLLPEIWFPGIDHRLFRRSWDPWRLYPEPIGCLQAKDCIPLQWRPRLRGAQLSRDISRARQVCTTCIFLFRPGYALGTRRVEQWICVSMIGTETRSAFRFWREGSRGRPEKFAYPSWHSRSPCNWNTETSVRHRVNNVVDADPNSQCREFFRILRRIGPLP